MKFITSAFELLDSHWVRTLECVVLVAIPSVLVMIFALPTTFRESLRLDYTDPTLLTAYASHFVHFDTGHLLVNIFGYVVCVGLAYGCCLSSGRRNEFWIGFATVFLVFPLVFSVLNILPLRPRMGYGFSGIVLAFVGFLPLGLVWFMEDAIDSRFRNEHALMLFFLGATLVAFIHLPTSLLHRTVVISAITVGGVAVIPVVRQVSIRTLVARGLPQIGCLELAGVTFLVYFTMIVISFPVQTGQSGTIVNVYLHFLGFTFGFLIPFLTFFLLERNESIMPSALSVPHPNRWSKEPRDILSMPE